MNSLFPVANLYGFIFTLSFGALVQSGYIRTAVYLIAILYICSTVLACVAKTELKRCNTDVKLELKAESSSTEAD